MIDDDIRKKLGLSLIAGVFAVGGWFMLSPIIKPSEKSEQVKFIKQNEMMAKDIVSGIYPDVEVLTDGCEQSLNSRILPPAGVIIGCAKGGNVTAIRKTAFIMRYLDGRVESADRILNMLVATGDVDAERDLKLVVRISGNKDDMTRMISESANAAGLSVSCLATPEYPPCGSMPFPEESPDDISLSKSLRASGQPMTAHFVAERAAFSGNIAANPILCHDYLYGDGVLLDYDMAVTRCKAILAPTTEDSENLAMAEKLKDKITEIETRTKQNRKELMNSAHYKYRQFAAGVCGRLSGKSACMDKENIPIPNKRVAIVPQQWPFAQGTVSDAFVVPLAK